MVRILAGMGAMVAVEINLGRTLFPIISIGVGTTFANRLRPGVGRAIGIIVVATESRRRAVDIVVCELARRADGREAGVVGGEIILLQFDGEKVGREGIKCQ